MDIDLLLDVYFSDRLISKVIFDNHIITKNMDLEKIFAFNQSFIWTNKLICNEVLSCISKNNNSLSIDEKDKFLNSMLYYYLTILDHFIYKNEDKINIKFQDSAFYLKTDHFNPLSEKIEKTKIIENEIKKADPNINLNIENYIYSNSFEPLYNYLIDCYFYLENSNKLK